MDFQFYISHLASIIAVGMLLIIDLIAATPEAINSIMILQYPDD